MHKTAPIVPAMARQAMTQEERRFYVALGDRIRERRRELGITQTQLAQTIGLSQQTVVAIEKGRRRLQLSAAPALIETLQWTLEDLVLGEKLKRPGKRGPVSRLQRQFEEIRRLPKTEQRFISKMIDTAIAQADT